MSQATKVIPNQSRTNFRLAVQAALQAQASFETGTVGALGETYTNQIVMDTTSGHIAKRNNANDDWDYLGPIDPRVLASSAGTDTYAITLAPAISAYKNGCIYNFRADVANTTGATLNINAVAAKTLKKWVNGVLSALETGDIIVNQLCQTIYDSTADALILLNPASPAMGQQVQMVNYQTSAYAFGSTLMPADLSKPQKTEGDEYFTLAITPKRITNNLKIDVVFQGSVSIAVNTITVAVFQDTTTDAIAVGAVTPAGVGYLAPVAFTYFMAAGTVAATTFKVRAGINGSGSCCMNGASTTGQLYDDTYYSSITITEIEA
jgi:hypothetical protein